jgi:hypothetical protein
LRDAERFCVRCRGARPLSTARAYHAPALRRYSAIDFDYLEYHALRLVEYRRRRDAVLALVPKP